MKGLKYLLPIVFFVLAYISFNSYGILAYLPLLFGFGAMPIMELIIAKHDTNFSKIEEDAAKENKVYDYVLYFFAFLQLASLVYFFVLMHKNANTIDTTTWIGQVVSMGVLCGLFGINLSHELGHRKDSFSQWLAKLCLSTSLYFHFFVEHNKGHHKHFATPHDPASARYGESIYAFYVRAIIGVYKGAWFIANDECRKKRGTALSLYNEMIQGTLIQLAIITIAFALGIKVGISFLLASLIGALLLESVDYIQHYGLNREQKTDTSYERGMPHHSWDSHYPIGRIMLFELTRHSDHHYLASRKYQILNHHNSAPQMPTGYPGTILLALVPPLWFNVMNKRIASLALNMGAKA
jgi:alkane 1-monooxygenase